jgi:hypothetical protein
MNPGHCELWKKVELVGEVQCCQMVIYTLTLSQLNKPGAHFCKDKLELIRQRCGNIVLSMGGCMRKDLILDYNTPVLSNFCGPLLSLA